jgi:hypothetical protein
MLSLSSSGMWPSVPEEWISQTHGCAGICYLGKYLLLNVRIIKTHECTVRAKCTVFRCHSLCPIVYVANTVSDSATCEGIVSCSCPEASCHKDVAVGGAEV